MFKYCSFTIPHIFQLLQATADAGQDEDVNSESEEEVEDQSEARQAKPVHEKKPAKSRKRKDSEDDDADDWEKYQEEFKKENSLDAKVKESWPVHCPHYPEVGGTIFNFFRHAFLSSAIFFRNKFF